MKFLVLSLSFSFSAAPVAPTCFFRLDRLSLVLAWAKLRDDLPLLVVSAAPPEDSRETKCLCWVKPLTLLNRRPPKLLLVNIVLLLLLFLSLPFAFPFVLSVAAGDPQHLSI
jgi:hypothetical protein